MKTLRSILFLSAFIGFFAFFIPSVHAADDVRYLIKSDKQFLKKMLGVRQEFQSGFTTDASDLQLRIVKILGVDIEPVKILQILPSQVEDTAQVPVNVKNTKIARKVTPRLVPVDQTPWGVETIYNNQGLEKTSGGAGVSIAVIDTGVNVEHLDLKERIIACKDFTGRVALLSGKCIDRNGHGTHVAGIIAANSGSDQKGIYGVAPEASIVVLKACRDNGSCYADDVAAAIIDAANSGVHIINLSLGSDAESILIKDAINFAVSKGVLVVAAAGNDGPFPDSIDYPAAYATVIAVGALDQNLVAPEWTSVGLNELSPTYIVDDRDIEFSAPGVNIESTANDGGYISLSGTSMASPFVAGLAAKYWQVGEENPADSTRALLHTLAHDILAEGDDSLSGFGLPQVK